MPTLDFAAMLREERAAARRASAAAQTPARDARAAPADAAEPGPSASAALPPPSQLPVETDWIPSAVARSRPGGTSPLGTVPTVRLLSDWIDTHEHDDLIRCVDATGAAMAPWQELRGRRVQCLGGQPGNSNEELPRWASRLVKLASEACEGFVSAEGFNHVLVNEYKPGGKIEALSLRGCD